MANSKYEYVRLFEQPDTLLANTWIVVRIDGRGFSKLTTKYKFVKPNDRDALDLMNAAAEAVMKELPDLVLAYGNSDEYSFVFHKDCVLFERRASKLTTTITSTFTSYYVFLWSKYFPDKPLTPPLPSFDGRAVCYPSDINLRDYMSWRQVDCHINNLYNTTFWTLVQQGGMSARDAEQRLSGTVSSDKNEILFKEFGINYNNEPECFKKGTVLYRDFFPPSNDHPTSAAPKSEQSAAIVAPKPKRVSIQDPSRSAEKKVPFVDDQLVSPLAEGPGPTFLSPASTPSPPPSPHTMSRPGLPNPLRSNPVSPRNSSLPPITMPLSPPSSVTSPMNSMYISTGPAKHHLPALTPLPLSPPTLRPSTKPPLSLDPPNPTTRDNFSPTSPPADFPTAFQIGGYRHATTIKSERAPSHSASASMTIGELSRVQQPKLKQRSPSQPHLPSYFAAGALQQAPVIPLRISSIPANNKPRKLSLQTQRSLSTLKRNKDPEEKENVLSPLQTAGYSTPRRLSPPLRTNKALPSPPMSSQEEWATRERVRSNSQDNKSASNSPPRCASENYKRDGYLWSEQSQQSRSEDTTHPGIAELPATSVPRTKSHTRLHSAPTTATLLAPHQAPDIQALESAARASYAAPFLTLAPFPQAIDADEIQPTPPLKDSPRSRAKFLNSPTTLTPQKPSDSITMQPPNVQASAGPSTTSDQAQDSAAKKGKQKAKVTDEGGWASGTQGRPAQMSRSQKDRERKKRSKAKVLCEHVDIIKDEFWEKRPWILSGKTA